MNDQPSPQTVLEQAVRRARASGNQRVTEVRALVGELVPIEEERFRAEWTSMARGTPLANAALHIRRARAEFQCMACFTKYHPSGPEPACPNCGSVGAKVLSGEEFSVEEIR